MSRNRSDQAPRGAGTDVVEALELEWTTLLPSLNARLREWAAREPVLAAFPTAPVLLRALRSRRDFALEDAILLALLRWARLNRLAGRLVVQALLPGLKLAARRILFEAGERDELWSLLLANLWQRIASYPLERRPRRVAANLLLDTTHATLTELARARHSTEATEPLVELAPARPGQEEVEVLLARGVRAQVLSREEAQLILRTRLEGVPLSVLARELGVGYDALRVRRRRAERRLLLFLGIRDVRFPSQGRPLSLARVAGGGLAGSAGGGAVTHPRSRR